MRLSIGRQLQHVLPNVAVRTAVTICRYSTKVNSKQIELWDRVNYLRASDMILPGALT
jgi:hypothetical protein